MKPPVLTITMVGPGEVQVTGPLTDRMLCYGMLEMAREIVLKMADAPELQEKKRIVTPDLGVMPGRPSGT